MERMKNLLSQWSEAQAGTKSCEIDQSYLIEKAKRDCEMLNREVVRIADSSTIQCDKCNNRGFIYVPNGVYVAKMDCECQKARATLRRMMDSGLEKVISKYTFSKYNAEEDWQKQIKSAAESFAKNPAGNWFFVGGESGSGKSHICTAICREFLLTGKRVQYMLWRDDIVRIKNAATDHDALAPMLDRLKNVDVLYIDDLFKTGKNPDGRVQKPSSADINYAFEVINYRYCNPNLLTIISSEWSEAELLEIDEAIAGRIYEMAKTYTIAKDRSRNYRIRNAVTL